ncbi:MAG: hypothetical protein JWO15_1312 [Sphingomonadales bacterium]|jgi:hypothetical protein|nr:hypothetical protein [Sphingomonadales bacterium]
MTNVFVACVGMFPFAEPGQSEHRDVTASKRLTPNEPISYKPLGREGPPQEAAGMNL